MQDEIINNIGFKFDKALDFKKDMVYFTGSRLEGFGNETSDIDIYIISDEFESPTLQMILPNDKGYYSDAEVYTHKQIHQLSLRINQTSIDNFDEVASISREELDLYYRTAIAEPIINPELFHIQQSEFNKEVVAKVFEVHRGLSCQAVLARAELALKDNDPEAAYFYTQEAVGYAIDSVLAANGEAFPSNKWRFEKIIRAFGESSVLYREAWRLRSLGATDFMSYAQDGKQFCQKLGMGKYIKPTNDVLKYKRSVNVELVEALDHFYLVKDKVYIYEISAPTRYLWSMINGQHTKDELSSYISTAFKLVPKDGTTLTTESLRMLEVYGLIELT